MFHFLMIASDYVIQLRLNFSHILYIHTVIAWKFVPKLHSVVHINIFIQVVGTNKTSQAIDTILMVCLHCLLFHMRAINPVG